MEELSHLMAEAPMQLVVSVMAVALGGLLRSESALRKASSTFRTRGYLAEHASLENVRQ
jgi:hypothetical protein